MKYTSCGRKCTSVHDSQSLCSSTRCNQESLKAWNVGKDYGNQPAFYADRVACFYDDDNNNNNNNNNGSDNNQHKYCESRILKQAQ